MIKYNWFNNREDFVGFISHDLYQSVLYRVRKFRTMAHQSKILLRWAHWLIQWSGNQEVYLNLSTCSFVATLGQFDLSVEFTKVTEKKSDHNTVKFSYELNFRHLTIYFLSIHDAQPRSFAFPPSRNTLQSWFMEQFLSNHNSQSTKKEQNTASQKYLCSLLWEWFTCENNDIIPKGSLWIHSLMTINIIKTR